MSLWNKASSIFFPAHPLLLYVFRVSCMRFSLSGGMYEQTPLFSQFEVSSSYFLH